MKSVRARCIAVVMKAGKYRVRMATGLKCMYGMNSSMPTNRNIQTKSFASFSKYAQRGSNLYMFPNGTNAM